MPDTADERTLVWCTGISGSQRTDYVNEAAEAIRAEGRTCLVLDIGELLEQLPDHLKVGASRTELLDGNEDVLRLHRSYALQNMLRMIEETTADVVLISTHACFLRNGRLMPGLDMHFIKEHFAGRISAFVTVVLDTPDVWRALAQRPEWANRLRLAEVALWRDFEVALTRMLAEYEGAPFYLLARRDPAEGLARLTRRPPARSAYLSYPITAILQSGSTELIDGARRLAARLRDEAGLAVFDPLSIEDLPQTKAGAPPDEAREEDESGKPSISAEMEREAEPYLVSHTVATDLQLIDQADMVVVYYPTDKVSPGVFTEMSHARDRRKPLYLCEFPGAPEHVSPFLGLFHTAAFETVDGLIEHLRSEQQAG